MTTLERLRTADPARDLDPDAAGGPPARDRRHAAAQAQPQAPRAALALVPVTAAALAALFLLPGGSTDLAARAYAQTAPEANSILYVRSTMQPRDGAGRPAPSRTRPRGASAGSRAGAGARYCIARARCTWRSATPTASCACPMATTARREDGGDAEYYIDRSEPGFLANFRKAYENGRLDESGDARFAGRAAKRYVVTDRYGSRSEYFLDAETGMPLGSRQRMVIYSAEIGPDRTPELGKPNGHML